MHGRMGWGHDPHKRYSGAGIELDVPLVPAPHVWAAVLIGMLLGVMVGYKKAMMVQAHRRMMMGGMRGGYGGDGDWMARKKAMMRGMAMHHHHGYGSAPCCCGAEGEARRSPEGTAEGMGAEESSGL